jgi:hypothetical protein
LSWQDFSGPERERLSGSNGACPDLTQSYAPKTLHIEHFSWYNHNRVS